MATTPQQSNEVTRVALKRNAPGSNELNDIPVKSPYFENLSQSLPDPNATEIPLDQSQADKMPSPRLVSRLGPAFFQQPCIHLAKQLLGQVLVRMVGDQRLSGRIVETEAYVGAEDTACHTYKGKQTASNKSMFLDPGHAYVYMTYGMYHCINITSKGEGQAVLLRALSPLEGKDTMTSLRQKASKRSDREFKKKDLCNGPGKLCLSLNIDRQLDGTNLTEGDFCMWIESGDQILDGDIVSCPRIGIDSATKEWVEKPLRFYVIGNPCVSKRNKAREQEIKNAK
ncbi:DNA-3-methyladenine glycosylase-like [Lytechinus pictus]|uniref:DNA-3-methyladenine glycosylase-like n=1 Tax=Lytechinus pictus TaxID=7653 RepID=UPI0030BA1296